MSKQITRYQMLSAMKEDERKHFLKGPRLGLSDAAIRLVEKALGLEVEMLLERSVSRNNRYTPPKDKQARVQQIQRSVTFQKLARRMRHAYFNGASYYPEITNGSDERAVIQANVMCFMLYLERVLPIKELTFFNLASANGALIPADASHGKPGKRLDFSAAIKEDPNIRANSAYFGPAWWEMLSEPMRIERGPEQSDGGVLQRYVFENIFPDLKERLLEAALPRHMMGRPLLTLLRIGGGLLLHFSLSKWISLDGKEALSEPICVDTLTPLPWALALAEEAILYKVGVHRHCWFRIGGTIRRWDRYLNQCLHAIDPQTKESGTGRGLFPGGQLARTNLVSMYHRTRAYIRQAILEDTGTPDRVCEFRWNERLPHGVTSSQKIRWATASARQLVR